MSVSDIILLQGKEYSNMNNERITLTMKEQRINDILVKLIAGEIKTTDASRLTGLSERQIYRKKKTYK